MKTRRLLLTLAAWLSLVSPAFAQITVQPGPNVIALLDGSAVSPSKSYVNSSGLGSYRIGADNEGFAAAGVLKWDYNTARLSLNSINLLCAVDGACNIGASGATRPDIAHVKTRVTIASTGSGYPLEVGGTAHAVSFVADNTGLMYWASRSQMRSAGDGDWLVETSGAAARLTLASGVLTPSTAFAGPGTVATTGDIRLAHGSLTYGRNAANSANYVLLDWGSSTNRLTLGDVNSSATYLNSPSVIFAGVGPHAIGGATTAQAQLWIHGTFAGTGNPRSVDISPTLTSAVGGSTYGVAIYPDIQEAASGNHPILAGLYVGINNITAGAATVTDTTNLEVAAPASATVSGKNYSAWIRGVTRIDGNLNFNGVGSGNVMFKPSTTTVQIKLGDDSGFGHLDAGNITTTTFFAGPGTIANAGAARFANAGVVAWRNNGGTGNIGISLGTDDKISFDLASNYPLGYRFETSGGAGLFVGASGAISITGAAPSLAIGAAPSTTGAVRFSNATYIYWRNAANNGDLFGIGVDGTDNIFLGSAGHKVLANSDNSQDFGAVSNRWANGYFGTALLVGTTPATTGDVRLRNGGAITFRRADDGANRTMIASNANNQIELGDGNTGVMLLGTGGSGFIDFAEQSSDAAAPAADHAVIFAKDNGAGKTQLCARFSSGANQCFATQP